MNFKILTALEVLFFNAALYAQKLPSKQEASLSIPANVKINGKADEWNNQFQAYSNATQLKYTIANDGSDLYVVINADDRTIIQKIGFFGITVTVSPLSKNDNKISLTYPAIKINNMLPQPSLKMTDSLVATTNSNFKAKAKTIKITGVKDITETETSIYNAFDIRIAAAFDAQRNYTCEFLIPLKYLGLAAQSGTALKFDIQINGPATNPWPTQVITQSADGKYTDITSQPDANGKTMTLGISTAEYISVTQPFNFSGTYKLQ